MKLKTRVWLAIAAVALLGIAIVLFAFGEKDISRVVGYTRSDVTRFQILDPITGESSRAIGADENELMDVLFNIQLSYRGPYYRIRSQPDASVYHLYMVHASPDDHYELGSVILDTEGYLYVGSNKFKVTDESAYMRLWSLCESMEKTREGVT